MNYLNDILGMNEEDIKEIKTTFFNSFKDVNIVKEYNKGRW